jgi:hypothetical protein
MAYTVEDLKMATRHVALGERHVADQEKLVAKMTAEGLDTAVAEDLLEEFRQTLDSHRQHFGEIESDLKARGMATRHP